MISGLWNPGCRNDNVVDPFRLCIKREGDQEGANSAVTTFGKRPTRFVINISYPVFRSQYLRPTARLARILSKGSNIVESAFRSWGGPRGAREGPCNRRTSFTEVRPPEFPGPFEECKGALCSKDWRWNDQPPRS